MRSHGRGRRNRGVCHHRVIDVGMVSGRGGAFGGQRGAPGGGGGAGGVPKAAAGRGSRCPPAAARAPARPMPGTNTGLAPLPLAAIYAPRTQRRHRKKRTSHHEAMLDSALPLKTSLSPFHPLPAIGQKFSSETKVILFDLDREMRPATVEERPSLKSMEFPQSLDVLGAVRRKTALEPLETARKPQQQLMRENTYDVIEPIFLTPSKIKSRDRSSVSKNAENRPKMSARSRFKNAALQVAKLSAAPETGKLLCLRERETLGPVLPNDRQHQACQLQHLPRTPARDLDGLSEIFQCLDLKGRHREKTKRENSWF